MVQKRLRKILLCSEIRITAAGPSLIFTGFPIKPHPRLAGDENLPYAG